MGWLRPDYLSSTARCGWSQSGRSGQQHGAHSVLPSWPRWSEEKFKRRQVCISCLWKPFLNLWPQANISLWGICTWALKSKLASAIQISLFFLSPTSCIMLKSSPKKHRKIAIRKDTFMWLNLLNSWLHRVKGKRNLCGSREIGSAQET